MTGDFIVVAEYGHGKPQVIAGDGTRDHLRSKKQAQRIASAYLKLQDMENPPKAVHVYQRLESHHGN